MKKILALALVALISMSFVFAQGGSETSTTSVVSESGFNTDQVLTFCHSWFHWWWYRPCNQNNG